MHKCVKYDHACYTDGKGFYFEVAEGIKIMHERKELKIQYSEEKDSFWQEDMEAKKIHIWKGRNYETAEGIKHLYNITLNGRN